MTPPLLAACVVVTDEVADLAGCLASLEKLAPLLSQVHVYSLTPDDRVLDIARQAGASVASALNCPNVGVARNRAAAMADATWVLMLSSDEVVTGDQQRLAPLLDVEPGMLAQPDALSVHVQHTDGERQVIREPRLYRSSVAHYTADDRVRLVAKEEGRRLTVLTPGRDVIAIAPVSGENDDASAERARIERRLRRADEAVRVLERGGITGDDLVTALVDRARLLRQLEEDDAALADLTRARTTRATRTYRWRARQELATLLIKHGHYAGAERIIDELERDEADADYTAWLRALSAAAQGQARDALVVLRGLDQVVSADGHSVPTAAILNERMVMATRVGEFDEALDCCIQLVAVHGQSRRYARMLLKLWGGRSADGLADKLVAAAGPHQTALAEALARMPEPGPAVAASLLDESRLERPAAVSIM